MPERVTIRTVMRGALIGLALAGLGGCVSFGGKPPPKLLSIATEAPLTPGRAQSGPTASALFVGIPTTPKAIATSRVAVHDGPNAFAYVKKALWVDIPAHQFQRLLSETIAARAGLLVLDPGQFLAPPGHVLHGELVDFSIEPARHRAIVSYDASLTGPDGKQVMTRRFSATAPISKVDANLVAPAISAAANEVAAQVADWVKTQYAQEAQPPAPSPASASAPAPAPN